MRPPEPPSDDFLKFCDDKSAYERNESPYFSKGLELSEHFDHASVSESGLSDQPEMERIIFIQTRKVGYLIGHHGRTIWGFETATGAKIDILRPNSRDCETPVRITGSAPTVRHAIRLITDLYALHNFSSQLWQNVENGSSLIVEKKSTLIGTEEMFITPQFASFLIQNEFVCYIEAQSGSKILICREIEEFANQVPLNIVGEAKANCKALELIAEHKENFEKNPELMEIYSNLPLKIFVDNPYKKFGRCKRNYWRKPGPVEGETFCSRSGYPEIESDQTHFQDPDWQTDGFEDYHTGRESFESSIELFVLKPNFDKIFLHAICRYNNVTMETFMVDPKDNKFQDTNQKGCEGRRIVIRGLESNVRNAKLDLIREIDLVSKS